MADVKVGFTIQQKTVKLTISMASDHNPGSVASAIVYSSSVLFLSCVLSAHWMTAMMMEIPVPSMRMTQMREILMVVRIVMVKTLTNGVNGVLKFLGAGA